MLSLCVCDDCHRGSAGLWLNTMADYNRADGRMAMYVCERVCVCVHAGVCRKGRGACRWSLPVHWSCEVSERWQRFNTDRTGKYEKCGALFQNKVQKMTRNPQRLSSKISLFSLKGHIDCTFIDIFMSTNRFVYRACRNVQNDLFSLKTLSWMWMINYKIFVSYKIIVLFISVSDSWFQLLTRFVRRWYHVVSAFQQHQVFSKNV